VKHLSELAKDSWWVASVDLTPGLSFEMRTLSAGATSAYP
jgi:hypothetical protein